ncbi:MAG: NAD-dependent epimerase/dehydratase family protein [Candidatus Eisenbacteria bacterium]|uniref:NAD-dependent epimerase/dehydratase family protein n=1 Tax=Eiseniibacteriota bacterium TaxID=2212470 RepID=A0A7Y2E724_UNCEI|nr:NAD-dependent epimerase/dehydratase family protein [Candidatus Eisenbacteria bacterium]
MRVLVTGARGFTAAHLLAILQRDDSVTSIAAWDIEGPSVPKTLYQTVDITSLDDVRTAMESFNPEFVFHLAAVPRGDEATCLRVNLDGTWNVFEAARGLEFSPRVLVVSSAAVYGLTKPCETPVVESTPLRPVSPYGVSKAGAEALALSYHRRGLVPCTVIRPFNLIGPGLPEGFVATDFIARARAVKDAKDGTLPVGNLDPLRDFIDVRDVVDAYHRVMQNPHTDGSIFNVASGEARSIREILDVILEKVGAKAEVVVDPDKVRPVEVREQAGSFTAIHEALGWQPTIGLEQSIEDMLAQA